MNKFSKGQVVWQFGNWDRKGTCWYRKMVVIGCGKKQMALRYADSDQTAKHFVYACSYDNTGLHGYDTCAADAPGFDAEAEAMRRATIYHREELLDLLYCIERNSDDPRYCAAMQKNIDGMHLPAIYHYEAK